MPRRHLVASVVVLLIAGGAVSALPRQEVTLTYRWIPAEALTYRHTQESVVYMTVPGMGDMSVTSSIAQVQRLVTAEVADDGTATVRSFFDSMKMSISSPQMSLSWDSTAPSEDANPLAAQIGQTMGGLIGKALTLVIEPTGSLRSISGMDEIMQSITESNPQAAAAMSQMGGLDQFMSNEGMRGTFAQAFGALPESAVNVGDTWPMELKVPNPLGDMTIANVFTLNGVETIDDRRIARIGVTQSISATPGVMGPMSAEIYDATGEGELLFDIERGRVQRTRNTMRMPVALYMTAPDGTDVTIDGLVNATTIIELVEPESGGMTAPSQQLVQVHAVRKHEDVHEQPDR